MAFDKPQPVVELRVLRDSFETPILGEQGLEANFDQAPERPGFSLPPADRGKDAWLFLAASWLVEGLIWGFAYSFGILHDYYDTHEPFAGTGNVAVIGTTTTGLMYVGTPIVVFLCRKFPRAARWFTLLGLFMTSLTVALSSFCTTITQLIIAQGVMLGLSGCLAYAPCVVYIDEWFVTRKGMAYGLIWSAAGVGGAVLPFVIGLLLDKYGFETALRIWAGILFAATAPVAYLIRPRLPYAGAVHVRAFDLSYFTSRAFNLHQLANFVQSLGYFLPSFFLPSYARSIYGASGFMSTLTVLLVNISATAGCIIMGPMTDKLEVTKCIVISSVGATIGVLLIWGFSTSLPILYMFCVVYGLFAGSWTAIWPGIMREVSISAPFAHALDPMVVYGWLCVGRGIGNIASGPISSSLIKDMPWQGQAIGGYGSGFGSLIVFTGVSALLGGGSFVFKRLGLL